MKAQMKTIFRRAFCVLLMLCVLGSSAALAEKRTLCIAQGDVPAGFRSAHPDVSIKMPSYSSRITEMDLLMKDGLDAAVLYSGQLDMDALKSAGVLYDLSKSAVIREAVSRMHPDVQKYVTDNAGHIVALPYSLYDPSFYWLQSTWDAAGLTEEDVPQSYTELLDFLEKWMARTAEHPEKKICVSRLWGAEMTGVEKYYHLTWLMDLLRFCWETQQRYAGVPVNYDDPAFVALAERTREIGTALYKSEPRYKKRQKMQELFRSDISSGPYANNGLEYGVSHALPLRITRDQPKLLRADATLWLVRADTQNPQDALALLEAVCADDTYRIHQYGLYADYQPGAFPIRGSKEPLVVSQGWLDDWNQYDGTIVLYPFSWTWNDKPVLAFFEGKLSAADFAASLNGLVTLSWWERDE